jgi:hypothetical protein
MPRTITLAYLGSHQAVEVGDLLQPPGVTFGFGRVVSLDSEEIVLEYPTGRLSMTPASAGVVWMDEGFLRKRGVRKIKHGVECCIVQAPEILAPRALTDGS